MSEVSDSVCGWLKPLVGVGRFDVVVRGERFYVKFACIDGTAVMRKWEGKVPIDVAGLFRVLTTQVERASKLMDVWSKLRGKIDSLAVKYKVNTAEEVEIAVEGNRAVYSVRLTEDKVTCKVKVGGEKTVSVTRTMDEEQDVNVLIAQISIGSVVVYIDDIEGARRFEEIFEKYSDYISDAVNELPKCVDSLSRIASRIAEITDVVIKALGDLSAVVTVFTNDRVLYIDKNHTCSIALLDVQKASLTIETRLLIVGAEKKGVISEFVNSLDPDRVRRNVELIAKAAYTVRNLEREVVIGEVGIKVTKLASNIKLIEMTADKFEDALRIVEKIVSNPHVVPLATLYP